MSVGGTHEWRSIASMSTRRSSVGVGVLQVLFLFLYFVFVFVFVFCILYFVFCMSTRRSSVGVGVLQVLFLYLYLHLYLYEHQVRQHRRSSFTCHLLIAIVKIDFVKFYS